MYPCLNFSFNFFFHYSIYILSLLLIIYNLLNTHAAIVEHEIKGLPGWSGSLLSRTYTGYIGIGSNTRFLNYMFFEAQNDPENAPIVLWMQGGPGVSGFMGLFNELGPYNLNQYSLHQENKIPELLKNNFSWNTVANIIFFESPAGVGFSYCNDTCPHYDDKSAAQDNYEFLMNFFKNYPEFSKNDFYIAGESYGGIYIPTLANEIMTNENNINLKGVLVGNGCNGIETNGGCGRNEAWIVLDFLRNHGQISQLTYKSAKENCPGNDFSSEICHDLLLKMITEAGNYNNLNIYDECMALESQHDLNHFTFEKKYVHDYPCFQSFALNKWANSIDVKTLFNHNSDFTWNSNREDFYTRTEIDTFPYYQKMMDRNIKILLYFGDIDANVPYNGGETWVTTLGLGVTEEWHSWLSGETVAGYAMTFEGNLKYVTVRGAGHLVPQTRPTQALDLFINFINDIDF